MRRSKALVLVLVLAAAMPAAGRADAGGEGLWGSKIDPALLAAANGRLLRYIVVLGEDADLSQASAIPSLDQRRAAVVDARRTTAARSQRGLVRMLEAARASGAVADFHPYWITNAIAVHSTEGIMRGVAARPEVARVAVDHRRNLMAGPSAAAATPEWNIEMVGAPLAWDMGIDGTGAVVASIDTGIDPDHPSIAGKYRGSGGLEDYAWWDAINHEESAYDDHSHGTHTMGTMVGGDAGGPDPNDIGVAPGATFIAAKAFDSFGGGLDSWILEAAEFLTAPTKADGTDPRPDMAPDVINNSWGGGQCDPWFDEVLETWRAMEIFPAFAIGNSGPFPESTGSPGDRPGAFGVGATTIDDEIAEFSSRGPTCDSETKPEVSAPGQGVRSSVPGGGFDVYDGTSMATPHVAGAVALLTQAAVGSLGIDELETVLAETALDLGAPGSDNDFGAGRIQAFEAVQIAARGGLAEGVVTDELGDPIAGATITFAGGDRTVRVRSKEDGTYRARLLDGAYAVTVNAFAYLPAAASLTIVEQETTVQDFVLILAPIYTVSGTVTESPSGAPLAGATVEVLGTPLDPVTTDGAGAYAIDVPAGRYEFAASKGGCRHGTTELVDALAGPTPHSFALVRKLDAFGYVCEEVPFTHEPGTQRLPLSGYAESAALQLPFAFPFYGVTTDALWVSTTGYVSTSERSDPANAEIPNADRPNGAIYALWDELFVRGSARGVYTATYGTAPDRRVVIEYRNFEVYETGDLVNFAIVLFEDGDVEVRYRTLEGIGNGSSATTGIEDPSGTVALAYSFEDAALSDGTAVRYELGPFGRVRGVVTSAADGLPIEGASVAAGDRVVRTTADGTYQLSSFAGTSEVVVEAEGYEPAVLLATFSDGVTDTQDVVLDAPGLSAPSEISLATSGAAVSQPITISNPGTRPLTYTIGEKPGSSPLFEAVIDPEGDASRLDLVAIRAGAQDGILDMRVELSPDSVLDYLGGYLQLDVDQDPDTGTPAADQFGLPGQDVGFEYFLDLFDVSYGGTVGVWNEYYDYLGGVPAAVEDTTISFEVPLDLLGGDDGEMNLAANIGDWEPLDWAPDEGHGVIGLVGDVPWLIVGGTGGTLAPGESVDLLVTVEPAGLAAGENLAQVLYSSNDPRRPVASTLVRVEVSDLVAPTATIDPGVAGAVVRPLTRVGGTASDAVAGIEGVTVTFVSVLTGSIEEEEAILSCDDEDHPVACSWSTVGPASPGPYAVSALARDRAGNVQEQPATAQLIIV